ncbi:hypothetical protein VP1G_11242 [Cytospora mali]|uniref:Uncharacterized protein n=1 Tax=Cytospora mali TaxID=578113 RepID=A0A194VB84_CYTMA|nr:hypothetical protein VP1G_11242 [Valsa mali var. pyri (nom. inval.)]
MVKKWPMLGHVKEEEAGGQLRNGCPAYAGASILGRKDFSCAIDRAKARQQPNLDLCTGVRAFGHSEYASPGTGRDGVTGVTGRDGLDGL